MYMRFAGFDYKKSAEIMVTAMAMPMLQPEAPDPLRGVNWLTENSKSNSPAPAASSCNIRDSSLARKPRRFRPLPNCIDATPDPATVPRSV